MLRFHHDCDYPLLRVGCQTLKVQSVGFLARRRSSPVREGKQPPFSKKTLSFCWKSGYFATETWLLIALSAKCSHFVGQIMPKCSRFAWNKWLVWQVSGWHGERWGPPKGALQKGPTSCGVSRRGKREGGLGEKWVLWEKWKTLGEKKCTIDSLYSSGIILEPPLQDLS